MAGHKDKLSVFGFTGTKACISKIKHTLEGMQGFVHGYIDICPLTEELVLVCNDEGLINGLDPRLAVYDGDLTEENAEKEPELIQLIYGDCFICRSKGEDLTSIEASDIEWIERHSIHLYDGMDNMLCLKVVLDIKDVMHKK